MDVKLTSSVLWSRMARWKKWERDSHWQLISTVTPRCSWGFKQTSVFLSKPSFDSWTPEAWPSHHLTHLSIPSVCQQTASLTLQCVFSLADQEDARLYCFQSISGWNKQTSLDCIAFSFFSTVLWAAATTAVCPWHIFCRFCCAIRGAVLPLVVVQRWTWLRHWCNTWCHRFTLVHVLASLVQGWCNTWCHRFTLVHVLASLVQDWCNTWVSQVNSGAKDGKSLVICNLQ